MDAKITMIYWKSEKFWLGKILEHPEIMSQGETIEELEENLKDAYKLMVMDDVPSNYQLKEISVWSRNELIKQLRKEGCILFRSGAKHDIYINPKTGQKQPIPRHLEIDDALANHIKKYLGLVKNDSLS